MSARILIIDIQRNFVESQESSGVKILDCYEQQVVFTFQEAFKVLREQCVDVIILYIKHALSQIFIDFFSILRSSFSHVPVIGIADTLSDGLLELSLSDIVPTGEIGELCFRVEVLAKMRGSFDDNLIKNMHLPPQNNFSGEICAVFLENHQIIDRIQHMFSNDNNIDIEISNMNYEDILNCASFRADTILIDFSHTNAKQCYSKLRLSPLHKNTPIIMVCDANSYKQSMELKCNYIGCTDLLKDCASDVTTKARLRSFMSHSRLYNAYITKLRNSIKQSVLDSTTGVYNKSYLDEYIESHLSQYASGIQKHMTVMMIDIDKFKGINDKYGHTFADGVLKHVASIVKGCIRSNDIVARYGGDEFVIIMENVCSTSAQNIAERIKNNVRTYSFQGANCTVSIGVFCIVPEANDTIEDAITVADKYMYDAKKSGGDQVRMPS